MQVRPPGSVEGPAGAVPAAAGHQGLRARVRELPGLDAMLADSRAADTMLITVMSRCRGCGQDEISNQVQWSWIQSPMPSIPSTTQSMTADNAPVRVLTRS